MSKILSYTNIDSILNIYYTSVASMVKQVQLIIGFANIVKKSNPNTHH